MEVPRIFSKENKAQEQQRRRDNENAVSAAPGSAAGVPAKSQSCMITICRYYWGCFVHCEWGENDVGVSQV